MTSQAVSLEQVVVTGTAGNQERRAQAAVVASIDAGDVVKEAPVTTVTQLLSSRVPGVVVTDGTGNTGTATRILIRGAASISLSNQPLVFIDGVRMDGGFRGLFNVSGSGSATSGQPPSALNDLNPNDIESIEVVKGPAAATRYGADASAGAVRGEGEQSELPVTTPVRHEQQRHHQSQSLIRVAAKRWGQTP
jgi:outer membrane receptor for ferrienterochelin and colicin